MQKSYDIIIIGSGLGGGTRNFIPQEPDNWDGKVVFRDQRYTTIENWDLVNTNGRPAR